MSFRCDLCEELDKRSTKPEKTVQSDEFYQGMQTEEKRQEFGYLGKYDFSNVDLKLCRNDTGIV